MYNLSTNFIFIKKGNIVKKLSKKEFDKLTNGIIEIVTDDKEKMFEFLVKKYGTANVTQNNSFI